MNSSLTQKIESLLDRYEELSALLSDAEIIAQQSIFRSHSVEFAELEPLAICYRDYLAKKSELVEAQLLQEDPDPEIKEMAAEEADILTRDLQQLDLDMQTLLLPKDPNDSNNIFLEIRAGTGGDEAAIFAGDLFRMYSRYAESHRWQIEIISARDGEHGGYREVIARVAGRNVYRNLKFESGAHRVQRIPETESQGRVHTSACTVAVLPEIEDIGSIDINKSDLRIDTYRASGAGGQHVNKTDSAVRITHLPSGIVVECQDERSQHKNKARAMSLLHAKLLNAAQAEQAQGISDTRRDLVGSGDRSEKIRTYNFPQNRVTDHRINLTLHRLQEFIAGDLDSVIDALSKEYQADQLKGLSSSP